MDSLDDLLIKRRRGTLDTSEARRLEVALQSSREHQLALRAGTGFDAQGGPAPGDAELVRRLASDVERRWSGSASGRRTVRRGRLASALVFAAGVAAASYGGYRIFEAIVGRVEAPPASIAPPSTTTPAAPSSPVISSPAPSPAVPVRREIALKAPPPVRSETDVVTSAARKLSTPAPVLAQQRQLGSERSSATRRADEAARAAVEIDRQPHGPRAAEPAVLAPAATSPVPASAPVASASGAAPSVTAVPDAPRLARAEAAAALFERAQRLRQNDWDMADLLYRRIIDEHADSNEAGVAQMVLAKRALATGRERDALIWFRAYERAGGPLAAEALWGQARALEALGRHADARAMWRRLIERHPASPYAQVARRRAGE